MSCCPDINDIFTGFTPVSYAVLSNLNNNDGVLTRNGGVPGSNDAFAETSNWVDGTGCAMWVWTVQNTVDNFESNLLNYYLTPENPVTGAWGWSFTNQTVSFRRFPFLNSIPQFPIYYRNTTLGYNRFAIFYNNGSVWMLETNEFGTADPGWIGPPSYAGNIPTTTRYRLHVTVKPSAATARSSVVTEFIGAQPPCGNAVWFLPPLQWHADASVTGPEVPPEIETCPDTAAPDNSLLRVQRVLDFQQEIHRNIQLQISSVAPLTLFGYSMEWTQVSVSELTNQRNAYAASFQFAEWGHFFQAQIAYISSADLIWNVTVDGNTPDSYLLPNSNGAFVKQWVILKAKKGKLFDWSFSASNTEFQIIPSQSILMAKEFKTQGAYQVLQPFGDQT